MIILHNVLPAVASQLKRIRDGQVWSSALVTSLSGFKKRWKDFEACHFSDFGIKNAQPAIWRLILHESLARHVWFKYNGSDFNKMTE